MFDIENVNAFVEHFTEIDKMSLVLNSIKKKFDRVHYVKACFCYREASKIIKNTFSNEFVHENS